MFSKKINVYISLILILLLVGCRGKTVDSADEIEVVKADDQKIIGLWEPQNSSNFVYEFLPSSFAFAYDVQFKTGRRYKDGVLNAFFYWHIQNDGTINLTMVPTSCLGVVLSTCKATGFVTIVAEGKSIHNARWNIVSYANSDGVVDWKISDIYSRKNIDLKSFSQGEFFLQYLKYYDQPLFGELKDETISVKLTYFDKPITVSTHFEINENSKIEFQSDRNVAVTTNKEFFIQGEGYRDFVVKQWYEKVVLSASTVGLYTLSFEIHNEVQLPLGIDRSKIVLDGFENTLALSRTYSVINSFVPVPEINVLDRVYSIIVTDFNDKWVVDATANDINFTSSSEGRLGHTDINKGLYSEYRDFTWSLPNNSLELTFPGYGVVTLRFIKAIEGGYSVLIATPDPVFGHKYRIQDWIKDGPAVVDEIHLPGRYRILNPDSGFEGLREEITFHADKTVTGNGVGGYWFQDNDGDIVSYECIDLLGRSLSNYFDCFASFDNLSNVTFAHVRRIRFLHREGNSYQSKYDAVIYGANGAFNFPMRNTIAYTYRWTRVGDEQIRQ
jgi:hypothetical protein